MTLDELKPTERKMFGVLVDGELHSKEELHGCLYDELGPLRNTEAHLTSLRARLKPQGKTIRSFIIEGRCFYRLVRIFTNSEE